MKKLLTILFILCILSTNAQVTRIWTDYNNYWTSGNNRSPLTGSPFTAQDGTGVNPITPNTAHNLLAFRWTRAGFTPQSVVFSTGVNDARLTANGVSFTPGNFRALPINSVPLTGGGAYLVALGALTDGNQTNISNPAPFGTITDGIQKASFLTDGVRGLGLGSGLTNIPSSGGTLRFNMSTNRITEARIGDGIPDILVSQIAQADATNDILRFVRSDGSTVGQAVTINFANPVSGERDFPAIGFWNLDLFENNGAQSQADRINTIREIRFFAVDVTTFGITNINRSQVVALEYLPGGNSDPAFIAFSEPSLGISARLSITSPARTTDCDGIISGNFTVQLQDRDGLVVRQADIPITANIETGSGILVGTLTQFTNADGFATFAGLRFETGGLRTIRFSNTSLTAAITPPLSPPTNCNDLGPYVWTGDRDQRWDDGRNWLRTSTASTVLNFPNSNHDVEIPTGLLRYPSITTNAGARNIVMGANATISINNHQFAIAGTITANPLAKIIANTDDGVLFFVGTAPQSIPNGILQNGNVANLTIENAAGVTNADNLRLSQILSVRTGTFNTGGTVTMSCRFSSSGPPPIERRTALIGTIGAGALISGNITTEQCFPARRAFRFVTSSVTTSSSIRANWQENATAWNNDPNPGYGAHITGLTAGGTNPLTTDGNNGFDWQPSGNNSMFTFNAATQQYQALTSTLIPLIAGVPYYMLIRGNRSTDIRFNASPSTNTILRATGTIRQGDVNVSSLLTPTANHFNLLGNPYHSVVDMREVLGAATNLTPFYWVYDPRINARGGFVAVNAIQNLQSVPASQANNFLQPYQAFFVQTGTLGIGVTPSMIFTEASKVITAVAPKRVQTATLKMANNVTSDLSSDFDNEVGFGVNPQWLSLSLYTQIGYRNNETALDGLRIDFSESSTNNVTNMDAAKFINTDENLSRKLDTALISMENRATAVIGEMLPLELTNYRNTAYTMEFELSKFINQNLYLKDNFTNQSTLLTDGGKTTYNFTVNDNSPTSKNPDRFIIEIREMPLSTQKSNLLLDITLFPNPNSGNEIFVNATQPFKNGHIKVYNMLGQQVVNFLANSNTNNQVSIPITHLKAGVYMVNITTETGEKYASKFIRN